VKTGLSTLRIAVKALRRLWVHCGPGYAILWGIAQICSRLLPRLRFLLIRVHEASYLATSPPPETPNYELRIATDTEVMRALQDDTNVMSPEFVQQALLRGDTCVAAFAGDRVVSYGWCSAGPTPISDNVFLKVGSDYIYGHKANTSRRHRGKGLHTAVIRHAGRELAASRGKGMVAYIDATNDRSLVSEARVGQLQTGLVLIWLGRWKMRVWYSRICRKVGLVLHQVTGT
jgi:hypothetical protein